MLDLDVLIDEQTIYKRIDELASQIEKDYGEEELICICILKGSFPSRRLVAVPVDYVGFSIEDKFVVGFGLDLDQNYRNLPYIAYVKN